MCAGVNDINNLHLVNTISKPTQNFSIWVLCNRAVQYNVAAFSVLYMHWWERLCRGYIVTGTTSKSPNLVSSFISSSSLVPGYEATPVAMVDAIFGLNLVMYRHSS